MRRVIKMGKGEAKDVPARPGARTCTGLEKCLVADLELARRP